MLRKGLCLLVRTRTRKIEENLITVKGRGKIQRQISFRNEEEKDRKAFRISRVRKNYGELSKRVQLAVKPVVKPISDIETHLLLKEYKAQFKYIVTTDLKEIEYYTLSKNLRLEKFFSKYPELPDDFNFEVPIKTFQPVEKTLVFPENSRYLAVFEKISKELSTYNEPIPDNKIPLTVIIDDHTTMTHFELNRHVFQARNCSKVLIPGNNAHRNPKTVLSKLRKNAHELDLAIHDEITWNEVYHDVSRVSRSLIVYADVTNNKSSANVWNYNYGMIRKADHVFLVISGDGKFSQSAIKLREQDKKNTTFMYKHFQYLSMPVANLTPKIEHAVLQREHNEDHGVVNNIPPGTPILSSLLANTIIARFELNKIT